MTIAQQIEADEMLARAINEQQKATVALADKQTTNQNDELHKQNAIKKAINNIERTRVARENVRLNLERHREEEEKANKAKQERERLLKVIDDKAKMERDRLLKVIEGRENFDTDSHRKSNNSMSEGSLEDNKNEEFLGKPQGSFSSYSCATPKRDRYGKLTIQNPQPIVQSELYEQFKKQADYDAKNEARKQQQGIKEEKENDKSKDEFSRNRKQMHSPSVTCFSCATKGHVGVPCSKLVHDPLFQEVNPEVVYPHERVQFVNTGDRVEQRNQATSPIQYTEIGRDESKPQPQNKHKTQ